MRQARRLAGGVGEANTGRPEGNKDLIENKKLKLPNCNEVLLQESEHFYPRVSALSRLTPLKRLFSKLSTDLALSVQRPCCLSYSWGVFRDRRE